MQTLNLLLIYNKKKNSILFQFTWEHTRSRITGGSLKFGKQAISSIQLDETVWSPNMTDTYGLPIRYGNPRIPQKRISSLEEKKQY